MSSFNMNGNFNCGYSDDDLLDASTAALLVECFETTTLTDDIHHANSDDSSTTSVPHESDNNDRKPSPHEWQHDTSVHTDQTSVVLSDDSCDDVESKLYSLARKYNRCWDFPPRIVHSYEKCYRNLPRYAIVLGSKRNSKCKDFECTIIYRELRGTKYTPLEVLYYKLISRFQKEYLSNKDFEFLPAHEDHLLFLKEEIDPHHPDTYIYKAIKHVDRDETILSDIKNCGRRDKEDRKFDKPTLEEYIEFLYIEIQIKRRALDRMHSLHPMNSEYIPTVNKVLESLEATINEGIAGIEGVQKHRILLKNTWELYFPSLTPKKKRKKDESTDPDNNDHGVNDTYNTGHNNGNNDMPDQSHSNTDGRDPPGSFFGDQGGGYTGGGYTGHSMPSHDNMSHRATDICDESSTESSLSPWKYDSSSDDDDDDEEDSGDDNNDNGAGGTSLVKSDDRTPSTTIVQFQRLPVQPSGQSGHSNSFIANESEECIAADIIIPNSVLEGGSLSIVYSEQLVVTDDIMHLNDMKNSTTITNSREQQQQDIKRIANKELLKTVTVHLDEVRPGIDNDIGNVVKSNYGEQEKKFLEAAKIGNLDKIKEYVSSGVDPNAKNNDGSTVLHLASRYGRLDVLRYLIQDCKVDPNAKNNNGYTVLHYVSENGRLDVLRYLIQDCNVDLNAKTNDGSTVLHIASRWGRLDVLRYLIQDCNVDPNAKTNDGSTVLHYASKCGHLDILRYLIQDCNVDLNAKTNDGSTVLHYASRFGHLDVLRYLIQDCNVDPNAKTNNGWTVLHYASRFGHLDVLRYLIQDCNVDKEAKDMYGQMAYDLAPDIYTRIDGKLNVRESEDSDVANYSKKLNTNSATPTTVTEKVSMSMDSEPSSMVEEKIER